MMRPGLAAVALALALSPVSLSAQDQRPEGDPVIAVETTDARMNEASAEARATSAKWLAVVENPPVGATNITFKFPLEGYEHIWVLDVARDGDYVTGRLANNPHAEGWSYGDPVRVALSDISDWGYVDAVGKAHGYYTVRVMLDYMSDEQAAEVRRQYGFDD